MFDYNEKPDLNITPLVDVMLVLLAILMVTAPVIEYEENINLPKGSHSKRLEDVKKIEMTITKDNVIYINKKKYKYESFADNFNLFAEGLNRKTPIHIRADKKLAYEKVMYLLKTAKEAGFYKVSLITDG
jgi:biopolymer transport protein ExbD